MTTNWKPVAREGERWIGKVIASIEKSGRSGVVF
jgi:hypothetical protein